MVHKLEWARNPENSSDKPGGNEPNDTVLLSDKGVPGGDGTSA